MQRIQGAFNGIPMTPRDVRLSDRCAPDGYKFCSRAPAKRTYSRGFRNASGFGNRSNFSVIPSYDRNYNALFPDYIENLSVFSVIPSYDRNYNA